MADKVLRVLYAGKPETLVYDKPGKGKKVNTVLLGTWLGVLEEQEDWVRVQTAGPDGWVRLDDTSADLGLKVFFIDVGQGDGCLIELGDKRLLVDAGQRKNVYSYLRNWQFSYDLKAGRKIRLDAVVASHFDADHYGGLVHILKDAEFEIGTLYHNGIARFETQKDDRPEIYNTKIGTTETSDGKKRLITTFSTMDDADNLLKVGGLQPTFRKFLELCKDAIDDGRLGGLKAITFEDKLLPEFGKPDDTGWIEVLGPVPVQGTDELIYDYFDDESHTTNGHSIILKVHYGTKSILLGGDLNIQSENHLLDHYKGRESVFEVDVAKSCHHGSSEFTIPFMKAMNPYATVISSGDNESYAHPRADAIGAAGRYSRGDLPLVFSTELARSINSASEILYGMINCRTDGNVIVLAQMKEAGSGADVWDAYELPFNPRRH